METNYNDGVFINCPFDGSYTILFRACTFAVLDAGFIPRCSLEVSDGTQLRLSAILGLIENCRYGVHDLSRVQLDEASGLPRFNMPFELGLFHSAKHFGASSNQGKQCLILETEQYRYQTFISDIAGIDVSPHGDSPEKLILALRNWLVTASGRTTIPPAETTRTRFHQFQLEMQKACRKRGIDQDGIPFVEMVANMTDWLTINQIRHSRLIGS